jgi:SAM-dependent methyltransferase
MAIDQTTLDTYNTSARALAAYFKGIGPRTDNIDYVLSLLHTKNPDVMELGCGDGRDAVYITSVAKSYIGIDYSEGLLALAREKLPDTQFVCADMQTYDYGDAAYDAVFAFASVLHIPKEALGDLFAKIERSLRQEGVFYISTKHAESYQEKTKKDAHGERLFYFYCESDIRELALGLFDVVSIEIKPHGDNNWLEVAFRKK